MSEGLIKNLAVLYEQALSHGDPRVKDWPLMNPLLALGIIIGYLLVLFTLVQIMKRRNGPAPFMKLITICHNLMLTILSAYMCIETLYVAIINKYTLFGNGVDQTENGMRMARILWIFYASKILEFGDTWIMALRKNFHQISFLHVYHHTSIFAIWWAVVYYAPGGDGYFSASLNSFIHVLMYSYYLWAAFAGKQKGPKPVWTEPAYYRQYITTMQMIQFSLMLLQATYNITVPNSYPLFLSYILFFYMLTMLALFASFYRKSYLPKGSRPEKME